MELSRFVSTRRERWEELDQLVRRAARGRLNALTGDELLRLGRLYRSATSDLAVARRDFSHDDVSLYLNALVARAHPLVYQESGVSMARIGRFIRYGFPQAYRQAAPYIAVAFGVFVLSALVSAIVVTFDPSMTDTLLGAQAERLRGVLEQHHLWVKNATENHSVAANFIMLNNITVAFSAFAAGVLLGVGTLWIMAQNGIAIGGTFALTAHYGLAQQLWAFVAPHGVIELSVVFIAGGAGMMIGDAVLRPGLARRRDALADAARRAAHLIVGCVPLLVVAGTIEGFFSPSDAPDLLKFLVGLVTGALLYSYLLFSRPRVRPEAYTFTDAFQSGAPHSGETRSAAPKEPVLLPAQEELGP